MKKYSKKEAYSYTLGTTITLELLNMQPRQVLRIYIHSKQEANNTLNKILAICSANKIEVIYNDKIFNTLADKENCFIIGVFKKYESTIENKVNHLVLVNPSNNGNLGTIIRTAVGFGINNLAIIKPAVDIYDPRVIRASMGAIFNINFQYYNSFEEYHHENKTNHLYPFLLQTSNPLPNIDIKSPYSLVFGNEATGLSHEYQKIGIPVRIVHSNKIDSLNLDNAVSIALYEFTKNDFNK